MKKFNIADVSNQCTTVDSEPPACLGQALLPFPPHRAILRTSSCNIC